MTRRIASLTCAAFLAVAGVAVATAGTDGSTPAPASIAKLVTHVPASTLDTIGAGPITGSKAFVITRLHGKPYGIAKPGILAGALAWCPHCGVLGWSLAIALSRFGSLKGLHVIDSGTYFHTKFGAPVSETNIEGISFFGTRFSSKTVSFKDVIESTVTGKAFETPTKAQQALFAAFDMSGGFPVVDVGGHYGIVGSPFDPALLHGKTASSIASSLADPANPIAKHIDGGANVLTAAICAATNGQPAAVCSSKGVKAAVHVL